MRLKRGSLGRWERSLCRNLDLMFRTVSDEIGFRIPPASGQGQKFGQTVISHFIFDLRCCSSCGIAYEERLLASGCYPKATGIGTKGAVG
jgi:hypothetical protein